MKLYLVRHGKTNAEKNCSRQAPDTPLGKEGRKELSFLVKEFEAIEADAIISSPWARARETAKAIASKLNMPVQYIELVRERTHDDRLFGAERDSEININFLKGIEENYFSFDWKYLNDESLASVVERARKTRDFLLEKYREKNVVLVSHGIFFRCFLTLCILGENFDKKDFMKLFHSFNFPTASITLLEYDFDHSLWQIKYLGKKN